MSEIISINSRKPPTFYTLRIAHHQDGKLQLFVEDVADDERSRESIAWAMRELADSLDDGRASSSASKEQSPMDERAAFEAWFAGWADLNVGEVEWMIKRQAALNAWQARAAIQAAAPDDALDSFAQKLAASQVPLDAESARLYNENAWDLYATDELAPAEDAREQQPGIPAERRIKALETLCNEHFNTILELRAELESCRATGTDRAQAGGMRNAEGQPEGMVHQPDSKDQLQVSWEVGDIPRKVLPLLPDMARGA